METNNVQVILFYPVGDWLFPGSDRCSEKEQTQEEGEKTRTWRFSHIEHGKGCR
ncbi:MAG: hypothetical protein KZQ87_07205 [Candidatus Thiodiazotropha sp. (ex Cardiolucina cf. quadrata)]|nr:hypothetical protein [Candidatus Thiodiazotropha sp. (ex Cardiolucina cf. quadrata)]